MFPSINNTLGITACTEHLDNRASPIPSTECIIAGLKITLEENIAQFDDKVAKQTSGTAMGPHHSCSYADVAVDYAIDRRVMSEENPWRSRIGIWARFRDDIYCPWLGSVEELTQFDHWLNQLDPSLNFTLESSSTHAIAYLDLSLSIVNDKVATKIYIAKNVT